MRPLPHRLGTCLIGTITALTLAACAAGQPARMVARPAAVTTSFPDWPTDHGDKLRSGVSSTVAAYAHLSSQWSKQLDGAVYGSPIIAAGRLIVATENDTVYAFNPGTGQLLWSKHLRTPVPLSSLPCGNIDPLGITGTPVYDAGTGRVFVVAETNQNGIHHELFGLSVANGAVALDRRIELPGTDQVAEQQRAALASGGGFVYVTYGGLAGDCGSYKGGVLRVRANGGGSTVTHVVQTSREGGIWAAGGPVLAADGSVYFAVGNSAATSGPWDGGDSVTRLGPDLAGWDHFAPSSWQQDNTNDADLGSLTPAFTTNHLILQAGKSGTGYVLRQAALGGIGGQLYAASLCRAFGVSAVTSTTVYLPCADGVTRVEVPTNGHFAVGWKANGIPGSPVVGRGAVYSTSGDRLYALSGSSGATLASIVVGSTTRFATPALWGHWAFVGTTAGVAAVRVD